jgi:voltage-gated potassium channel
VLPRRYLLLLLIPVGLIAFGTAGYYILEPDYTLFDGLYMTVTTISTVGYGEVHKLHTIGRVFTIFLILGGVFTLFYTAGEMIRAIVSGEVRTALGRYRMEQSLGRFNQHVIVCGFGRMGRLVCREFHSQGIPFVVIEENAQLLADFNMPNAIALPGDATSDDVLTRAGVGRARALVAVLGSTADNLYITMSARLLNEKLFIVSRSEDETSEEKLRRAGANRVVSPYAIGGSRVAGAVLRPTVVDFIELATRSEHMELQIEETLITPSSKLVGTMLKESHLRQEFGIIIVAIKKAAGSMVFNPPSDARIEAGDILITLGHRQQLDQLEAMARG